jgi:hypothetical protein
MCNGKRATHIKLVNIFLGTENTASISLADVGFQPDGVIVKYLETTYENIGGGGSIGDHAELLSLWCNLFNRKFACIGIAEGQTNVNNIELDITLLNPLPPTLDIEVYDYINEPFTPVNPADKIFLGILFQFYKYI